MSDKKIPLLIIGGGPAGLTAAIYARRAGIPVTIWEEQFLPGGQMATTPEIENVPGVFKTDGFMLSEIMTKQAVELGAVIENLRVTDFLLQPGALIARSGDISLEAGAIILAMGARRRKLDITGEDQFAGRGVSYCAICDGRFAQGKEVVVIGGGNTAIEDALHLANLDCLITLIHRRNEFRASSHLLDSLNAESRIKVLTPYIPVAIEGEKTVQRLHIKHVESGEPDTLEISSVFACVGTVANTETVKGIIATDGQERIIAGEDTETGIPGVFAAGDIRQKPLYQIVTATADGAVAATKAAEFLRKK